MASSSSFDIVCEMNLQEVTNAVDQARREVANRYDFRGSKCEIELDQQDNSLRLTADDEMKMQTLIDVLLTKLVKREVPTKALVYGKTEPSGKLLKKQISVQDELSKDQCKEITKLIKDTKIKVQAQIQGDSVRITGKKKDELQTVMQELKSQNFDFDMQFTNYR